MALRVLCLLLNEDGREAHDFVHDGHLALGLTLDEVELGREDNELVNFDGLTADGLGVKAIVLDDHGGSFAEGLPALDDSEVVIEILRRFDSGVLMTPEPDDLRGLHPIVGVEELLEAFGVGDEGGDLVNQGHR